MHLNYFIMLIGFISPSRDCWPKPAPQLPPMSHSSERGAPALPIVNAMPSSMSRSLSFAAKQNTRGDWAENMKTEQRGTDLGELGNLKKLSGRKKSGGLQIPA